MLWQGSSVASIDLQASAILLRNPTGHGWHTAAVSGTVPRDLDVERSRAVTGILSWVGSTGQMCGLGSEGSPNGDDGRGTPAAGIQGRAQFWPLRVGTRVVGVLELIYRPGTDMDPQRDRFLATLVSAGATALEQERLFREEQEAAVARESDRPKSALLSSVSHDLRTPLAGIKAAVGNSSYS